MNAYQLRVIVAQLVRIAGQNDSLPCCAARVCLALAKLQRKADDPQVPGL